MRSNILLNFFSRIFYGILLVPFLTTWAFAEGDGATGTTGTHPMIAVAAFLGLAIAAFGGALGQGKAISTALEGVARNPNASNKIMLQLIIGLALIESLVIYTLLIAFRVKV